MLLQLYTFELKFVYGKDNIVVDTLWMTAIGLDDKEFRKQMARNKFFTLKLQVVKS